MLRLVSSATALSLLAVSLVASPASAHQRRKPVARAVPAVATAPALSPEFKQQLFWNGWWQYLR